MWRQNKRLMFRWHNIGILAIQVSVRLGFFIKPQSVENSMNVPHYECPVSPTVGILSQPLLIRLEAGFPKGNTELPRFLVSVIIFLLGSA